MRQSAYSLILKDHLHFKLTPISVRELLFIQDAPCEILGIENGLFKPILHKNSFINKQIIKDLIEKGQIHLFVAHQDRRKMIEYIQNSMTQVTRTLSQGQPLEKGKTLLNLMTLHLGFLYRWPTDDDLLKTQHQVVKNCAYFLLSRPEIHEALYHSYIAQKHHYVYAQPIISSLFLLGFLKYSHLYSDKEIEDLFVTSYFKDIGMAIIPVEKYDLNRLNDRDRELMAMHPQHSVEMLRGRLLLSPNHLQIIENHHSFSLLKDDFSTEIIGPKNQQVLAGFETMIVTLMDIMAAMLAGRPFRKASNLFESLDMVKMLIGNQYQQEFRMVVSYFKLLFQSK